MSCLQDWQLLPHERTAQVCEDLFGHRPSAGSIVRSVVKSAAQMEPAVTQIASALSQAPVLHADETGVRCAGKPSGCANSKPAPNTATLVAMKQARDEAVASQPESGAQPTHPLA